MSSPHTPVFRLFGSPYTIGFHHALTYLRLRRAPTHQCKLYCSSYLSTILYATFHKSRTMGTQTPWGITVAHVWDLDDVVEQQAKTCDPPPHRTSPVHAHAAPGSLRIDKRSHPQLHAMDWAFSLYTYWWLGKTSLLYRFFLGESTDVIAGLLYYFFIIPAGGRSMAKMVAPFAKQAICGQLAATGVSQATAPYMTEHFLVLCQLLDRHFAAQQSSCEVKEEEATSLLHSDTFVLGTPHPTMTDVMLGSVFSAIFLMDDPPASHLMEKFPHLVAYVERVTGSRSDGQLPLPVALPSEADDRSGEGVTPWTAVREEYPDEIPTTLLEVLELVEEVLPFLLSQVAALRAYMTGPDVRRLQKIKVERGRWKGCHGYLLPALTPVESLMIVDDNLLTVRARAFDLELALRAGEAVCPDEGAEAGAEVSSSPASIRSVETPPRQPKVATNTDHQADSGSPLDAVESIGAATGEHRVFSANHTDRTSEGALAESHHPASPSTTVAAEAARPMPFAQVIDPEDADFYRAFTKQMRRRQRAVQLSTGPYAAAASSMLDRESTTPASSQTSSNAAAPSDGALTAAVPAGALTRVECRQKLQRERLEGVVTRVTALLQGLSFPLYTIATVPFHRRYVSVLLAEHEVEKVRRAEREAAGATPQQSHERAEFKDANKP